MVKALQSNQSEWEAKCSQIEEKFQRYQTEKEAKITELKEEVRDLMFYMDAQNTINNSEYKEEIANGSIKISPSPNTTSSASSSAKKSRNKKK